MKTLMNYIILVAVIIICLFIIGRLVINKKKDRIRYDENMDSLFSENYNLKARNGQLASQVKTLRLTVDEFEEYVPELESEIHNLRIKLKKVESVSVVSTEIKDTVFITLKDTVVLNDNFKKFDYKDEFADITGTIKDDGLNLSYSVKDSLIQVVHKGRYQKWYHCFTRKLPLVQTITSKNPNSTILYNRHIIIEKKKK